MRPLPDRHFLIVDDHSVVRRGLRQLFELEFEGCVCSEAATVAEALLAVGRDAPDLVLCDLSLEGRGGIELTKQLSTHYPDVPVLIISMHDEMLYAQRAIAAGARGYVMKRGQDGEVVRAASEVLAGRMHVSDAVRQQMEEAADEIGHASGSVLEVMTDRELEIFMLIGQGYAPRHIADMLSLSVSTVEVYRERIKEKLGLRSSPLLLRYAVRWCKDHDTD